jgi:hypothetical protein
MERPTELPDDRSLRAAAAGLGRLAGGHPLIQRLKRLEEQIREDPALAALWAELEEAEETSGGCGSGGCSSGGCGASKEEGTEGPPRRNGGPKPGQKMGLYQEFSDSPVLQEYVQVRHRFYVLVDGLVETMFENLYGKSWLGLPQVDPLQDPDQAPIPVGFAGVALVDVLEDDDDEAA